MDIKTVAEENVYALGQGIREFVGSMTDGLGNIWAMAQLNKEICGSETLG